MTSILRSVRSYTKTVIRKMASNATYEDAVLKLNSLQSNKATLEKIKMDLKTKQRCTNLEDMENYLLRTGVTLQNLDSLSVIHVAGTKGKGSTSSMCESILRHHGYKTGFYSSPHLIAVRERIRIDGQIISREKFAKYFHNVFNLLENSRVYENDMPKYFAFLTVLAYNVFLKEKVDVAIVEVGIGGIVDYTNILRKVPVVGITPLGLDHTSILGNTIEEIAWAKAGIMKNGCEAYTVAQQINAMEVLHRVAREVKCPLYVVPDFKTYLFPSDSKMKQLPVELEAYCMNMSLAVQLAHAWMRIKNKTDSLSLKRVSNKEAKYIFEDLPSEIISRNMYKSNNVDAEDLFVRDIPLNTLLGLKNFRWPGRFQTLQTNYAKFYLDGAHTKESMELCAEWFNKKNSHADNQLIFSATGDRDPEVLLQPLNGIKFQNVFFVIPKPYKELNENNDNYSAMEHDELVLRCKRNAKIWSEMNQYSSNVMVMECVAEALKQIKLTTSPTSTSVLITGSLHLVGAALSILDPNLNYS